MQPHMFAGMHDEDEDDYDDTFDLSGWMSRSPPEGGLGHGHFEEPPMLEEEPQVRPRARARSNAHASAQFTPPMPNPYQGIAGTPKIIGFESPFNPLWVDEASIAPKFTLGTKILGFSALTVSGLALVAGKIAHGRVNKETQEDFAFTAPIMKKLAVAGFFGYLHPVLGLNHGALKKLGGDWKATAGKVILHAGGLVGAVALIRRV